MKSSFKAETQTNKVHVICFFLIILFDLYFKNSLSSGFEKQFII